MYSTFNAHKSKAHREDNWKMFKKEIVNVDISDENKDSDVADEQMPTEDTGEIDDVSEEACEIDLHDFEKQLEHNLAALFLKMQTILHIPERSVQEVIKQLCDIHYLSEPLLHHKVKMLLKEYDSEIDESIVKQVSSAVSETNVMTTFCGKVGSLAAMKKRASYVSKNFPLVMPVEYVVDK